jgi:hypothetical protein
LTRRPRGRGPLGPLRILILSIALTGSACGAQISDGDDGPIKTGGDAVPAPDGYRDLTIPAGTLVPMSLTRSLSSDANGTGDRVTAELTHALSVDGYEVLTAGTRLEGLVTEVIDEGPAGVRPMIAFRFTRLQTHGQEYDVQIAPLSHPPPAASGVPATKAVRLLPGADVTSPLTAPLTVRIHVG